MENVPSTAILAIVAIVAACILGAWVFSVVTTQRQQGNQAMKQTEQMNVALDESKYTIYDGSTQTGSMVLSAIQQFKDSPIAISVNNGSGTYTPYIYQTAPGGSDSNFSITTATKMTQDQYTTAIRKAQDPADTTYIIKVRKAFAKHLNFDKIYFCPFFCKKSCLNSKKPCCIRI